MAPNPIPISSTLARSVNQGGWGAWEIATRYSSIDLSDGPFDGGELNILSLGVNWWLSPIFSVSTNYRLTSNQRGGVDGEAQGAMIRILLMLD